MDPAKLIVSFLGCSVLAGLLGALAMTGLMALLVRLGFTRGNMVLAVGSLLTRSRDNARLVGVCLHLLSAVIFGELYAALMMVFGMTRWPMSFFAGIFFGVFHGIVVGLSLCWMIAEHHPLEEYRKVTMSITVAHIAGHIAYGAVVGLVIAFAPI